MSPGWLFLLVGTTVKFLIRTNNFCDDALLYVVSSKLERRLWWSIANKCGGNDGDRRRL
jgi:hypothetical protein